MNSRRRVNSTVGRTKRMTFILIPNQGEDVQINAWNWRPTIEFLRVENVITSEHAELLTCHGTEARVDADLANRMAGAIENRLLIMKPGERLRADLTVTAAPKPLAVFGPGTNPDDIDANELYSATHEWLVTFRDFCRRSHGFLVS
jgi:hypothetical protein